MTNNSRRDGANENVQDDGKGINLGRRRFIQAASAAAGAGVIGISVTGEASAEEFDIQFADRRVREARKAWEKGYRGRPDRTLGVISDGLESRHPDVGPWNGIRAIPKGTKKLKLVHENLEVLDDVSEDIRTFAENRPIPQTTGDRHEYPFTGPDNVDRMIAHAKGPAVQSNGLRLLLETSDGKVIESFSGEESPHAGIEGGIEPGSQYVLVIENTMRSVSGNYFLEALYYTDTPDGTTNPFANVDPDNITVDTPKVLGWYNEDYNTSNPHPEPWGGPHEDGNGVFIASIMAGSGRASAIDESSVSKDAPQKVLVADEHLVYEVEAQAGTTVFGSAYGDRIQVEIFGPDGEYLGHDHGGNKDQTRSVHTELTVHETGRKTYEVHVHPKRQTHTFAATSEAPARVERVCAGAFKQPSTTVGDRTEGDPTFFAGIAPNSGIVGLSGWKKTRKDLGRLAQEFARKFNLRVVTISLGFGNDLGTVGGKLSNGSIRAYKKLARAGVLTVSRTMEQQPPALRDRAPAVADESIHVAKVGPWDGTITDDTNEPAALDDDGNGVYRKPDVTALGSARAFIVGMDEHRTYAALSRRVDNFRTEDDNSPIRGYGNWGGASAQPPFVAGTAGLVAQALEEEAPAGISLPPPEEAGFADTMRLKQTILATASETPFTAGPWHAPQRKEPRYDFGGHDPIEGWGRVNIDAAVEAATRNLTPPSARADNRKQGQPPTKTTVTETVGLMIPRDSRAVAGHIAGEAGVYEVSINFKDWSGDDSELVSGRTPHLDLFVYDAENPAQHGTPNIIARAQGLTGSTSVRFTGAKSSGIGSGGTYYVVSKLVNVPGAFNSLDIHARFNLTVKQIDSSPTSRNVKAIHQKDGIQRGD